MGLTKVPSVHMRQDRCSALPQPCRLPTVLPHTVPLLTPGHTVVIAAPSEEGCDAWQRTETVNLTVNPGSFGGFVCLCSSRAGFLQSLLMSSVAKQEQKE